MLRREEGQTLVLSVVFLAALLGCAALVLDVGSWFRDKRGLQATADAAALAGAQSLPTDPGGAVTLAVQYANQNGGNVAASDVSVTSTQGPNDTISVKSANQSPGFFTKLFGITSVGVDASATARVELPTEALHVAPMVVSDKHPLLAGNGCPCFGQSTTLDYDPMGAPGAFGMLDLANDGGNVGSSTEGDWILKGFDKFLPLGGYDSDPGAKFSSANVQGALSARIGTVLLFPVFHKLTGSGSNAVYDIVGWVGFHLDSFTVHGNNAVLSGSFTRYIAEGIQSQSGQNQPDFGVRTIQLIH
jgi:Flp pilus assembly protein TadG